MMDEVKKNQLSREVLKKTKTGLWTIEIKENSHPKMSGDEVMENYLGVKGKKYSPEELYDIWFKSIDKAYHEKIQKAINKMKKGKLVEFEYISHTSKKDLKNIRVSGTLDKSYTSGVRIEGIYQNITDFVQLQKKVEVSKEELVKAKNSITTYTGIMHALCRDYESVYYVNIDTFKYKEYIASENFSGFKIQHEGEDFFDDTIENIPKVVYVTDRAKLIEFMNKETILPDLKKRKTLSIRYRVILNKKPVFFQMNVVPALEKDSNHYIFAIQNVTSQVDKEKEYTDKLRAASEMANTDGLTGVKNRLAFEKAEEIMNSEISGGVMNPFSICVFDVNNLKKMNDKFGHEAGDQLLCEASRMICSFFSHSPVYRIGGDEFAVILIGADYFDRKSILTALRKKSNINNKKTDAVVIASGLADYDFNKDMLLQDTFSRADKDMYLNKKKLKETAK